MNPITRRQAIAAGLATAATAAVGSLPGGRASAAGRSELDLRDILNLRPTGDGNDGVLTTAWGTSTVYERTYNRYGATVGATAGSWLIYEPLIRFSPANGYVPTPWLAESWTWNEDGTQITFKLREDVLWSDGEQFDAEDVRYTIEMRHLDPLLMAPAIGVNPVVETPDAFTVVVSYDEPAFHMMSEWFQLVIVPEHIWSTVDDIDHYRVEDPVGTGPYQLERFAPQQITLVNRDDYWGGPAKGVKTIKYLAKANTDSVFQGLLQGELDFTTHIPLIGDPFETFQGRDPDHNHYWLPQQGNGFSLLFNNVVAPFDNVDMRRAVALALNYEALLTLSPGRVPGLANVSGIAEPIYTDWIAEELRGITVKQDVEGAKAALERSGYTVDDGKLINPDGDEVPLRVTQLNDIPLWGLGIQPMLEDALGIKVEYDLVPERRFPAEGDFQMCCFYDFMGLGIIGCYDWQFGATKPIGEEAGGNWQRTEPTPEVQQYLDVFKSTDDEEKWKVASQELSRILADQRYTAPIASFGWVTAYQTKKWVGWPDEEQPEYSAPVGSCDYSLTFLNLTPAP